MRIKTLLILSVFLTLLIAACSNDIPVEPEEEYIPVKSYYPKAKDSFRIVSYNVGSFGKYIEDPNENILLVRDLLKELDANVVALNELDSMNNRHMMNQVEVLANEMGNWNWYFGRSMSYRGGAYGNGVMVPNGEGIVDEYTVSLPNPTTYESRSIAVIETARYVIAACHLGHQTEEYIQTQIEAVNKWADERYYWYSKPVFLAGDMNSIPSSDAIVALETGWEILSANENTCGGNVNPTRCIDYVFHYRFSSPVTLIGGHTPMEFYAGDVTMASDHHPIYVDIEFN